MNSRSRTLSNTFFSSVGLYTEYVLGMLTSVLIARYLGPDGFGTYSLVIWMVGMGVAISNSGTASAAIKFVAELRGSEQHELIPYMLDYLRRAQHVFLLLVMLGGATLFGFAGDRIAPGANHWLLLGFLVVAVALRASYMFNIGVAKGFENFRATALVALVSTPTNLVLVLLAWKMSAPVEGLLAVFVVSSFVFFGMSRYLIVPLVPERKPGMQLPPLLLARVRKHMMWTALTVSVGFFVTSEVEVMFLNIYADSHAAGQFKVAYQLAVGAALLVPGVFGALLLPMMASALSRGREFAARRFVSTTAYLALLAAPLMAFGTVFGNDIIQLMYGVEYAAAGPVFVFCLIGACLAMMTSGASSLLISADRQSSILLLAIVCGLVKLGLDAVLIAYFGLTGATIAFVSMAGISAVAYIVLGCRVSHAQLEWGRLARIMLAAALAGLAVWPLRGHWLPWVFVPLGAAIVGLLYVLLTLLLGCWSRGDIEHLQHLHMRFVAGRPRFGARLLEWAHHRAHVGGAT